MKVKETSDYVYRGRVFGIVRGAGRRGSVACRVAQRALLLCAFMFVCMSFMYFRLYFTCILAFLYLCVLPYMA